MSAINVWVKARPGRRVSRSWISLLLALTMAGFGGCKSRAEGITFVRVAAGPAGGAWYPFGAKMASVFEAKLADVSTSSLPGGGEANVMDIHKGNAELGFTYSSAAYTGFRGEGQYPGPQTNIRHFATLYPAALQTAVPRRSDIYSYDDLARRSISPGQIGWTGTLMTEKVLGAHGLSFASIRENGGAVHHVDFSDSGALMKDGHIDAFMAFTSVPQASFMELNLQPGIRFLGIDLEEREALIASDPSLLAMTIPHDAYPGMDADVPTIGIATVLVINKDVPDDLVYEMAKVFWESREEFVQISPAWNDVHLENALRAVAIPVHPGAQRYYDELGITP